MNITEQAQVELKKALVGFNKPGAGIHIFTTQGCCGPSIQMDLTQQIKPDEMIISLEGIDFFVANDLVPTLSELTIEFGSNGFRLVGMKKNGSCCG